MKPRFLDACLAEIEEALFWYGEQSPELPDRMLEEISDAVEKLTPFPEAFHLMIPPYRRVLLSRFPYSLFFRIGLGELLLVAFIHQQSDPRKWRDLLKGR